MDSEEIRLKYLKYKTKYLLEKNKVDGGKKNKFKKVHKKPNNVTHGDKHKDHIDKHSDEHMDHKKIKKMLKGNMSSLGSLASINPDEIINQIMENMDIDVIIDKLFSNELFNKKMMEIIERYLSKK